MAEDSCAGEHNTVDVSAALFHLPRATLHIEQIRTTAALHVYKFLQSQFYLKLKKRKISANHRKTRPFVPTSWPPQQHVGFHMTPRIRPQLMVRSKQAFCFRTAWRLQTTWPRFEIEMKDVFCVCNLGNPKDPTRFGGLSHVEAAVALDVHEKAVGALH